MITFCTISDKKYMLQGLAMVESIFKFNPDYRIFWLCMDDETYKFLLSRSNPNILPVPLSFLEAEIPELLSIKNSASASKYGTQYGQYCWALTPVFISYLMRKNQVEHNSHIMYIDSDILFYYDPARIIESMKGCSIGIHSHRYESKYDCLINPVGMYNVGVVVFKNNDTGLKSAASWALWMLNPFNRYSQIYGTCGDQKYLDLFEPLFGDVCVFDDHVGYLAPWCVDNVTVREDKTLVYREKEQPVMFFHFSHFNYDMNSGTWKSSYDGEWDPCRYRNIKSYYDHYFSVLHTIHFSYNLHHA